MKSVISAICKWGSWFCSLEQYACVMTCERARFNQGLHVYISNLSVSCCSDCFPRPTKLQQKHSCSLAPNQNHIPRRQNRVGLGIFNWLLNIFLFCSWNAEAEWFTWKQDSYPWTCRFSFFPVSCTSFDVTAQGNYSFHKHKDFFTFGFISLCFSAASLGVMVCFQGTRPHQAE